MINLNITDKFFLNAELNQNLVESGEYNLWLVFLSYVIVSLSSFIAISFVSKLSNKEPIHTGKTSLLGGFFLGGGIWSMHFTGMLAYKMDMVHTYSFGLTLFSLLVAICFSWLAFDRALKEKLSFIELIFAAIIIGLAVVMMHYTGMAAMEMDADLRYKPGLFWLSVIIAIVTGGAAIVIMRQFLQQKKIIWAIIASCVMGLAVCAMHYIGMEASVFIPYADCEFDPQQSHLGLVIAVTSLTFLLIVIPGFLIILDKIIISPKNNNESLPKWHYVYYVLAGFDIITVIISLFLNHQIMNIYYKSADINMLWSQRQGDISSLSRLATQANAPGNDVFESREIKREKAKLTNLSQKFQKSYVKAIENIGSLQDKHFPQNVSIRNGNKEYLMKLLHGSNQSFFNLESEANKIFKNLLNNKDRVAGLHMAMMDRHFGQLSYSLSDALEEILNIQSALFNEQIEQAKGLKKIEYTIAAFIFLMIIGATIYGHRLAKVIKIEEHKKKSQKKMLNFISGVQSEYITIKDNNKNNHKNRDKDKVFISMLEYLLELSNSEYGFIGEIFYKDKKTPYLKTHAITDISWNEETRDFYQKNAPEGLEFYNLDTLFGHTIKTGEVVIANDPINHPASGGLPDGHPELKHYLGVPIYSGEKLVGMVGISNKPGGYQEEDIKALDPIFSTLGTIIDSMRDRREQKEVFKKLQEREESYERAVNGSSDGLWDWDVVTDQVVYSPRFKEMLGYTDEDFPNIFESFKNVLYPDDKSNVIDAINHHIKNKDVYDVICRIKKKDQTHNWFRVKGQAIWQGKKAIRMSGSISDITDLKEKERKLLEQRHTLEIAEKIAKIGNWMVDTNDNKIHWSPQVYAIYGRSIDLGEPNMEESINAYHPDDRDFVTKAVEEAVEKQKPFHFIKRLINNKGEERLVESFGQPEVNKQGEVLSIIGTFEDITEKKAKEEELRKHRDHLQDLIQEQTQDIVESKEEAERANEMKSDFLANMSHELRTPMHAIISFSRQGIEKIDKWSKDRILSHLSKINESGIRLSDLLNNLLDLSKLESGKYEYSFDSCNINSIINSVVGEIEILAQNKNISLKLPDPDRLVEVKCDKSKIHRVILNLMSNAIKFNYEGKQIVVACGYDKNHENVIVSVSDEGIGIPEEELKDVFDKFIQGSKTKSGAGGTGLGLAICKEIIEGHNGKIWAENNKHTGSVFYIKLPNDNSDGGEGEK